MPPALQSIFSEIQTAYQAKLYYLAMAVTLTIPDICAGAELDLGTTNVKREHYEAWCRAYLIPGYKLLHEADVYCMRGGMIHTGQFTHRHQRYQRPFFTVPGPPLRMHDNVMENMGPNRESALTLDLEAFVDSMKLAATVWYAKQSQNANVKANIGKIICMRPHGIAPFVVGSPVVG